MDAVPCSWNGVRSQESFVRNRPGADTLSKLAKLMARVEHKQDGRSQKPSALICKECEQEFPDLAALARHQQREHALRKPHRCHSCGQEFALPSTLQLHKCLNTASVCQVCRGKPQRGAPCSACLAEPSDPQSAQEQSHHYQHRHHHDSSPYACAPCGRAFGHKQELLYHQQAGGCQPAQLSPKALAPPAALSPLPSATMPMPSYASLPPSPLRPGVCMFCPRTFHSSVGLANHRRLSHPEHWMNGRTRVSQSGAASVSRKEKGPPYRRKEKGLLFPCRSCDKVFSHSSMLLLHRDEEHRREKLVPSVQRPSVKSTRQRKKGETYPCSHCGKVFLHHLTRWTHCRSHSTHNQSQIRKIGRPAKALKPGQKSKLVKEPKLFKAPKPAKERRLSEKTPKKPKGQPTAKPGRSEVKADLGKRRKEREKQEEDGEFPCPSCAEVFSSQSALREHEEVHQPMDNNKHCSVCTQGMAASKVPGPPLDRVYHCVPCRQAFVTLDTFLQHCQMHLLLSEDEGEASLSDH